MVQGDTFTVEHARYSEKLTFKLNASRNPKEIDLTTQGGNVMPGIYELDGDTWRLCLPARSEGERPTTLSPEGGRYRVTKRQK